MAERTMASAVPEIVPDVAMADAEAVEEDFLLMDMVANMCRFLVVLICNICGDEVGVTVDGELFVACFECGLPVCQPCFEYERKEGNQLCPQCKSRYNRQKGGLRVPGDDEEDDTDDLENEFAFAMDHQHSTSADALLHGEVEERLSLSSEVITSSGCI